MPEPRTMDDPISGERIVIRTTAADSGGALLAFDLYLPPGGHVPAWHAHPLQQERFTIVSGRLRVRLGRRTVLAGPGESVLIPARTTHWFDNPTSTPVHARVEVRPALRMQEVLETGRSLGQSRQVVGPRLTLTRLGHLARFLLDFERELAVPLLPPRLSRALLAPLAWLAR